MFEHAMGERERGRLEKDSEQGGGYSQSKTGVRRRLVGFGTGMKQTVDARGEVGRFA
jgi:hypothetical protein